MKHTAWKQSESVACFRQQVFVPYNWLSILRNDNTLYVQYEIPVLKLCLKTKQNAHGETPLEQIDAALRRFRLSRTSHFVFPVIISHFFVNNPFGICLSFLICIFEYDSRNWVQIFVSTLLHRHENADQDVFFNCTSCQHTWLHSLSSNCSPMRAGTIKLTMGTTTTISKTTTIVLLPLHPQLPLRIHMYRPPPLFLFEKAPYLELELLPLPPLEYRPFE